MTGDQIISPMPKTIWQTITIATEKADMYPAKASVNQANIQKSVARLIAFLESIFSTRFVNQSWVVAIKNVFAKNAQAKTAGEA